jgi:hypothetical protein
MIYDSEITTQGQATTKYGLSAKHHETGYTYMANTGNEITLELFGYFTSDGVSHMSTDYAGEYFNPYASEVDYNCGDVTREVVIGVTGMKLVEWGQPTVLKPRMGVGGGGNAGMYTSKASTTLRATKLGAKRLPVRVLGTKAVGGVAGRLVPYLGWGLLTYDLIDFSINFPWIEAMELLDKNQAELDKISGGTISIIPRGPKE